MTLRLPADKIGCLGPVEEYASPGVPTSAEGASKERLLKKPRGERNERAGKNNRDERPRSNDVINTNNQEYTTGKDSARPATSRTKQTESVAKRRTVARTHEKRSSKDDQSIHSNRESSCFVDDLESVLQITHYSSYDGKFVVPADFRSEKDARVTESQRNGFGAVPCDSIRIAKDRRNAETQREDSACEVPDVKHKADKHRETRETSGSKKLHRRDSKTVSNVRDIYCRNINRPSVNNMVMDVPSERKVKKKLSIDGETEDEVKTDDNSLKESPNTVDDKEVMTLWKNRHNAENEEKVKKIAKKIRPEMTDNKEVKTLWTCDDKKVAVMKEIFYESVNENKAKVKKSKPKADRIGVNLGSRKSNRTPGFGNQAVNNVYIVAVADDLGTNKGLPEYDTAGTARLDMDASKSRTSFLRIEKKTKSKKGNKKSRFDVVDGISKSAIINKSSFSRFDYNSNKDVNTNLRTPMSTNNKSRSTLIAKSVSLAYGKSSKVRRAEKDKKTIDWTGTEKYVGIPSNTEYLSKPRVPTRQTHEMTARSSAPDDSKDFKYVAEVFSTDPDEPSREQFRQTISQLSRVIEGRPEVIQTYETNDTSQVARTEQQQQQRTRGSTRNDPQETSIRPQTLVKTADPPFSKSRVTLYSVSSGANELPPIVHPETALPVAEGSMQNPTMNRNFGQGQMFSVANQNNNGREPFFPALQSNNRGSGENYPPVGMNSYAEGRHDPVHKIPKAENNQQTIVRGINAVENHQQNISTMNHASGQGHNSLRTNSDLHGRQQTYPPVIPNDIGRSQQDPQVSGAAETSHHNQSTFSSVEQNWGQMYPTFESGRRQAYLSNSPHDGNRENIYHTIRPDENSRVQIQTSQNSPTDGRGRIYPVQEPPDEHQRHFQPTFVRNEDNRGQTYPKPHPSSNDSGQLYPSKKPNEDCRGQINPLLSPHIINEDSRGYINPPLSPHIIIERGSEYPVNAYNGSTPGYAMNPPGNGHGSIYPINPTGRGPGYPQTSYVQGPTYPNPNVNMPGYPAMSPEGGRGSGYHSNTNVSVPRYDTLPNGNGRGLSYPVDTIAHGQGYAIYHNDNVPGFPMHPNVNGHPLNPNVRFPANCINPNGNGRVSTYPRNPNINGQCYPVNPNESVPVYPHQYNGKVNGPNYPIINNGYGRGSGYTMNRTETDRGPSYPTMCATGTVTDTWLAVHDNNTHLHYNKDQVADNYERHQKQKSALSTRGGTLRERDPNMLFGQQFQPGDSNVSYIYQNQTSRKRNREKGDSFDKMSCAKGDTARRGKPGKHSHHKDTSVPCGCGQEMRFVFALNADDATECAICIGQLKDEFTKLLEAYKRKGYDGCCCKEGVSVTQLALEYLRGDNHQYGHGSKASEISNEEKQRIKANKRCEERRKIMEQYVQRRCNARHETPSPPQESLTEEDQRMSTSSSQQLLTEPESTLDDGSEMKSSKSGNTLRVRDEETEEEMASNDARKNTRSDGNNVSNQKGVKDVKKVRNKPT